MKADQVSRTFTLSKYDCGRHHFDPKGDGHASFAESLSPLNSMIQSLLNCGVPLGTKIEVIMRVRPKKAKKAKG